MPNTATNPYLDIKSSQLEQKRKVILEKAFKDDAEYKIEWKDITREHEEKVEEECKIIESPNVPVFKQLIVNDTETGVVTCSLCKDVATPKKHYNYWIRAFEKDKSKVYVSWLKKHVRNYHAKSSEKTAEKRKAEEQSGSHTGSKKLRGQPILEMRTTKLNDEKKQAVKRLVSQALCDNCVPMQQMENLVKSLSRGLWELAGGDLKAFDAVGLSRDSLKRWLEKERDSLIDKFKNVADTLARNGMSMICD